MSNNAKPDVNGISPKEGYPGTKLTIRGENLGTSVVDILHIFVGTSDVACSVQWHSSKKLNIITSFGEGELKIIVVTKSGGEGTCDVDYIQSMSQSVGLQEPVSFWPLNEPKQHQVMMSYSKSNQPKHIQSEMIEDIQDVMLGHHNVPMHFALSDDELVKYYKGRGSTALTEQDFNPILFLLKYHYKTNYVDLIRTLQNYRAVTANDKMKEPISIVKANLYTIFQCLECLETLKKKIDDEKSAMREMSGAFAEKNLSFKLEECKNIAHHMYEEVLKRRDYADSVRSALSVMERFRFLFNLPHSIRENISKGEYSLVINDYLRARSLFGSSEIRLFQQVYKDVVDVIDKFKEMLKRQLLEMPKKCENVKVTIRLLRQLEVDYDPTWTCLENQCQWILQAIRKLNVSAFSGQSGYQTRLDKPSQNSTKHPTVQLVHELNKILSETFNETWHLTCYYLESVNKNQKLGEEPQNRKVAVEKIVHTIVMTYAHKMRENLIQNSLPSGWLVYCLQQVRTALETLQMEELSTASSSVLIGLLEELRAKSVRAVLLRAEQDIASLAFKENWSAEISDQVGAVTRLPIQYRNAMLNSFSEVTRIIHSRQKMETPVCNVPSEKAAFSGWICAAMKAFITCIETILDKLNTKPASESNSGNDASPMDQSPTDLTLSNLNVSRLLLLMANNCHHCIVTVNPAIVNQIRHQDLPDPDAIMIEVQRSFEQMHERLVTRYIDLRLESLVSQVLVGIRANKYDWKTVPQATGARGYVHTVLAGLAQSHSELELICPHLSRDCIIRMVVRVIEEVNRVVQSSDRSQWSRRGHMQLAVDLGVFESVLTSLSPDQSSNEITDLSREATSLMNIMRGGYRLVAEDQVVVRNSLKRENNSIALLIQGFRETGFSMKSLPGLS